jgi:acyl-CoA thioester hydrolase
MTNAETGELAAICEITGVHMDRSQRKSVPFEDLIREVALRHLAEPVEA